MEHGGSLLFSLTCYFNYIMDFKNLQQNCIPNTKISYKTRLNFEQIKRLLQFGIQFNIHFIKDREGV